jgi:hypothetical protein
VDIDRRLQSLRRLQRLLDEAFRVPGTNVRFGWDSIAGLIPGAGDLATALLAGTLIVEAHRLGVPRVVQLRMLFNVGIDLLVGSVPLFGDVADVFWKANTRNMALLERHVGTVRRSTAADWAFIAAVVALLAAVAVVPVLLIAWLIGAVVGTGGP